MASKGNHGYSNATRKTAAVVMVGVLVGIVALASAQFLGWFASTTHVTLYADRAGLVMKILLRIERL